MRSKMRTRITGIQTTWMNEYEERKLYGRGHWIKVWDPISIQKLSGLTLVSLQPKRLMKIIPQHPDCICADLLTWGLVMPSVLHPPEAFVWLWRPRPREETLSLFLWASLAVCANWEPFPMVSRCSQRKEACHGPKSIPRNDFPSCWMYDIPLSKALPFAVSAPDIFLRAYVRMWSVLSILFSFCNNMGWGVNYDLHWEHPWVSSSWIGLLYQCWKAFKIRSQTSLAPFLSRPGRWACFGFRKPPKSFYQVLFHEVCTINFWGLHH